jgi:sugar phosphate isomerase/epimerase
MKPRIHYTGIVNVFFFRGKDPQVHLSILTDEISQDLEHALEVCRDLGVDTVELRAIDDANIVFHDEQSLQRIRSLLDAGNFRVCAIASPFLKCHFWGDHQHPRISQEATDFDTKARQFEILERSFVIAHLLRAPLVRTFSFWRLPDPPIVHNELLATLSEAVHRTQTAGLKLVIENEHACNIATGAEAGWLFERIPSEAFGAIWDPGNEAMLGSNPFPEGYSHVRSRVAHVHLKDKGKGRHERFVRMSSGSIDYVGQFRALAQDGYNGMLSLETHYKHPEGGAERATRESFAALRAILQEAGVAID